MNAVRIWVDQNLVPMEARPEMMPTLASRVKEIEPSDSSRIARRPRRPAISTRITTATNVNSATAQDVRVIEFGLALGPRLINK